MLLHHWQSYVGTVRLSSLTPLLAVLAALALVVLLVNGWQRSIALTIHASSEIIVDMILVSRPGRLVGLHRHIRIELLENER